MNKKVAIIAFIIVSSMLVGSIYSAQVNAVEPIANLVFKTNGGGVRPDYGLYIAQYLAEIGINVQVKVEEWSMFVGTLLVTHDFDLAFVALVGGAGDPDPSGVYLPEASLNMFGLDNNIPYVNQSTQMIKRGVTITNLEERQQLYYDWQQLMMDKIIPMLPFYSPRSYVATWSNLKGYDNRWGVVDSLPYMSFEDTHEGQESTDQFVDSDANWKELNPLLQDDASSSYISSLVMEPILQMSPDYQPLTTGLVESWEQVNDSYFVFHMRHGVYWNPSYDVTARDENSGPLNQAPLMVGLKGESSDGTNQEVTAKDAVFTYLAWANPITSEDPQLYNWIKAIWVDPQDEYTFHLVIDGDPQTAGLQPYAPFWVSLTLRILPEFFLNSTDTTVTYSSGGVPMKGIYDGILDTDAWKKFSVSAFGCGKYMLDYYIENSVTVLRKSPYWEQNFGIGAIDGTKQTLDIGTVIIRVIPDETSALSEFKAGKLDIMGLTDFPAERKKMQQDQRFTIYSRLVGYVSFMGFNLQRPFIGGENNFKFLTTPGKEDYTVGVAIRKAICYAIDREEINQVIHDGEFLISDSPIYPIQGYWYNHDIIKYRRDLSKAMEWLTAAGYGPKSEVQTTAQGPFAFLGLLGAVVAIVAYTYRKRK